MTAPSGTESRRCFTALFLVFILGACQAPEGVSENAVVGADATQGSAAPAASAAVDTEEEAVMAAGQRGLEGDEGEGGPPAIALQPGPPINDNPDQLMGLDPIGIEQRLGAPELRRREPPAEVWQYRTASCVLDLFLYAKSGIKEVVYVEARDFTATEIETRQCLRGLLLERQSAAEG
jgi:hypothetical protein